MFLGLAAIAALTKLPSSEEGSFSDPARNLLHHGTFGTTVVEGRGIWIEGIDRYTYWIMPLHAVLQAGWYSAWGESLWSLRALSILFGLAGILSWFLILRKITGKDGIALTGALLLACNYVYINSATYGRMDMMAAALNFGALAAYLTLRERSLTRAFVAAHSLTAAAGMTHFLGLCGLAALLTATVWNGDARHGSFKRTARLWLWAALPYGIAGVAWLSYITRDFPMFLRQFGGNAQAAGRMAGLTQPWNGFLREFTERFAAGYGLGAQSAGHASPAVLAKLVVLLIYGAAVLSFAAWPRLRRERGAKLLLTLTTVVFGLMTLVEGQKLTIYLIHIVPYLSALTAVWLYSMWQWRTLPQPLIAALLVGMLGVDAGGVLLRGRIRQYQNDFEPMMAELRHRGKPGELVLGRANLVFGLSSALQLKDDIRLGYYTRSKPQWIVVEEEYREAFDLYRRNEPEIGAFIDQRLQSEYDQVFETQSFQLYRRKPD
jgi:hypothetical protein